HRARYGGSPARHLVGGGFAGHDDLAEARAAHPHTAVYAPVKDAAAKEAAGQDPYAPRPGDGPAVAAWRVRMGTAEGRAVYERRAGSAELSNAPARNRG